MLTRDRNSNYILIEIIFSRPCASDILERAFSIDFIEGYKKIRIVLLGNTKLKT